MRVRDKWNYGNFSFLIRVRENISEISNYMMQAGAVKRKFCVTETVTGRGKVSESYNSIPKISSVWNVFWSKKWPCLRIHYDFDSAFQCVFGKIGFHNFSRHPDHGFWIF